MSADDPVFNLMSELVIHLKLLAIQLVNHQQVAVGFITAKLRKRLLIRLLGNDGQVSSDVSKPPPGSLCESLSVPDGAAWRRPDIACGFFPVGARLWRFTNKRFV